MNAILDIIVPVFGTVAVGWLIGRSKLLSPEGLRGLTNVTFYALFPALLFRSMSKVRLEALSFDILLVFFGTGLLLYFASHAARPRDRHEAGRGARCSPCRRSSPTASASASPSSPTPSATPAWCRC